MNTPINEAVELLPCPFCGAVPDAENDATFQLTDGVKYGAVNCCGTGPEVRTDYKDVSHWKHAAIEAWNSRAALPPPIVEPVRYEARMRAPNGNLAGWHESDKQAFEKHRYNSDIGDGFSYEVRALYGHAPASAPSDGAADARDDVATAGWLIEFTTLGGRAGYAFHRHNCVADYLEVYKDATSCELVRRASTHTTTGGEND